MLSSFLQLVLPRQKPKELHPCFLVGYYENGVSSSHINRFVLFVNYEKRSIQTRDVAAVHQLKGKVVEVHLLGRVTVPVRGHLNLPKKWVKDAMRKVEGRLTKESLTACLETKLSELASELYEGPERTTTLEIYEGTIVNHFKEQVFADPIDPGSSW